MSKFWVTILFLLSFFIASSQERLFQLWNQNALDVKILNNTTLGVSEKIHYTPKTNNIDLKYADITLEHKLTGWFEIGGGGRLLWIRKEYGWLEEKRPMLYGNLSVCTGNFEWLFSNRIEYRFLNKADDHFRHRQKLDLNFPEIRKAGNLQFYTSIETFYKFHPDKLHLARFYAGLKAIQKEHFGLKLYYVLEKNKTNSLWSTADILGVNMNFDY
jgi:hypothetical protein